MCPKSILALELTAAFIFGILQVCHCDISPYGKACTDSTSCQTSTEHGQCVDPFTVIESNYFCFGRQYQSGRFEVCPKNITTYGNISGLACIGVPDPVQNVQATVYQRENDTISFNVTWDPPTKYVGPVAYHVQVIGDIHSPADPRYMAMFSADGSTFHVDVVNRSAERNYSIFVTTFSAVGHASTEYPVRITDTKPYFSSNVIDRNHDHITSFSFRLCSACLTHLNQGSVEAVAIIVCDINSYPDNMCEQSIVNADFPRFRVEKAEDLNNYPTWAMSKDEHFTLPFRVTPDDFHKTLQADNSSNYIFTVGGSHCSESDSQTYCNGPLNQDSVFRVSVVVCNHVGCFDSTTQSSAYNTKPVDDDDKDVAIIGLSVGLGIAVLLCLILAVLLIRSRVAVFKS